MMTMQDDIRELLRVLGLFDGARDSSPHEVMADEVIPAVAQLRQQRDEAIGLLRLAQPIVEAHCDRKAKSATDHDGIKRAMDLGFAIFTLLARLDAKKGAT